MPGVLAVYTGADLLAAGVKPFDGLPPFLARPDGTPAAMPVRHVLATGRVRHVGEAVAAVVAESREAAHNAAEAIVVDYEDLPAVADLAAARAPGAPALCDAAPDNVVAQMCPGDAAATAAAFAAAAHVVSLDIVNQRLAPSAMEPRVVLAEPEAGSDRLVVTLSSQMPTAVRDGIAGTLPGLTPEQGTGARGRRRRRLRHEDRPVSRGRGGGARRAPAQAARQVVRPAARGIHGLGPWPRPHQPRRDGARRQRQGARTAHPLHRQRRRLPVGRGRADPAADRPLGHDERVRHPDGAPRTHRGDDQHHASGCLPRRGAAGGDLHHRAADGRRGRQDRPRPGRAAPAQPGPARPDALQQSDGADLRRRPVRAHARPGARARATGRASRRARPNRASAASSAAAASPASSNGPAATRWPSRPRCTCWPTASSSCTRPRRPWARASSRVMRNWRSTSSACRSSASVSSRATPTAPPASAVPAAARCSPAAAPYRWPASAPWPMPRRWRPKRSKPHRRTSSTWPATSRSSAPTSR